MLTPQSTPLTDRVQHHVEHLITTSKSTTIPVIGLSGPQGSGKSMALCLMLQNTRYNIAGLGLDEFYLGKSDRIKLAETVSPLFETRGPPGTHDLSLLEGTLDNILNSSPGSECKFPKFDKATDDIMQPEDWSLFQGKPDAIIIEGWMVGATLPPDFLSAPPANEIEGRDTDGAWRRTQYEALAGPYAHLWDRIDNFVHIVGPGFGAVLKWRLEQEASNLGVEIEALPQARRDWVASFIQYFERLTNSMHAGHRRQGVVLQIDAARELIGEK